MLNILFFFSFSALVVAGLYFWIHAFWQKRSTGSLMEPRPSDGSPFGLLDVILIFFLWLVGQAVSIGLITLLFGIKIEALADSVGDTMSWATILIALGQLVATFLAIGVFLFRYRRLSVIGWQPNNFRRDLGVGLVAFAMVIPIILALQWLLVLLFPYKHPTMDLLAKNANGLTLLATWFSAVVVAPICEEFFFRGVLQSWLQRLGRGATDNVLTGGWDSRLGSDGMVFSPISQNVDPTQATNMTVSENPYEPPMSLAQNRARTRVSESSWASDSVWPIIISSGLFALAHAGQGPAPIPLFVFGIALGYLFRRTGSIVPCIILHLMLNAFSMFWFTLQVFFGDRASQALADPVQGVIGLF